MRRSPEISLVMSRFSLLMQLLFYLTKAHLYKRLYRGTKSLGFLKPQKTLSSRTSSIEVQAKAYPKGRIFVRPIFGNTEKFS